MEGIIDISGYNQNYNTIEITSKSRIAQEVEKINSPVFSILRGTIGYIRKIEIEQKLNDVISIIECSLNVGRFINNKRNKQLLSEGILILDKEKIIKKKYYLIDHNGNIIDEITKSVEKYTKKGNLENSGEYNINNVFFLSFSGLVDRTPFVEYKNCNITKIFGSTISEDFYPVFLNFINIARSIKPTEGNVEWFSTNKHNLPKELLIRCSEPVNYGEYIINPTNYKGNINEGLIKTYPTLKTIEYVRSEINKNTNINSNNVDIRIFCPRKDGRIYDKILVYYPQDSLTEESYSILVNSFSYCGYYLAGQWTREQYKVIKIGYVCLQFEPKIGEEEKENALPQFLYHLTDLKHYQRIMQYGLCPRSNNKLFKGTPERIYFFTVCDIEFFVKLIEDKNWNVNNKYKILIINRELIPNVRFFNDPRYEEKFAVYTTENIPNNAIVDIKTLYNNIY